MQLGSYDFLGLLRREGRFLLQHFLLQSLLAGRPVGEDSAPSSSTGAHSDPIGDASGVAIGMGAFSWDAPPLPPVIVVHGRRGANSNINGIYTRDYSWQKPISSCYRRSGALEHQQNIFLYLEGEWRLGPSPDEGSVWAFAPSAVSSPLSIKAAWQVWDGQRVVQDNDLRVSDTSVIPSVFFLSFSGDAPNEIRAWQGMLVQEPGLWEGRPYYRHQAFHDFFLLCSVAEAQWRLGPLPIYDAQHGRSSAVLFATSAATLPHEIIEPWYANSNTSKYVELGGGVLRLSTTSSRQAAALAPRPQYPLHIIVQGFSIDNGSPNGVYRRAREQINDRPVYHKTDTLRAASLWFSGEWRLGNSIRHGTIWAIAPSTSSLMALKVPWQRLEDNQIEETAKLVDANDVIPSFVFVAGDRYLWTQKLCDARPVYQRDSEHGSDAVFLFFRAHLAEWWLGPVIGGSECYATAFGSRLQVVPPTDQLAWQLVDAHAMSKGLGLYLDSQNNLVGGEKEAEASHVEGSWYASLGSGREADYSCWHALIFSVLVLFVTMQWLASPALDFKTGFLAVLGCGQPDNQTHRRLHQPDPHKPSIQEESSRVSQRHGKVKTPKASSLSCVVCMDAPREVLLMPCRHVCICRACADKLQRCPMCRAVKGDFTKVFL